ncbi:hypothetical protein LTR50_006574 [Elasticomyces elasticus]|nr:hypothetical protein LTR50_006574 [Elasticomyces elasticus]
MPVNDPRRAEQSNASHSLLPPLHYHDNSSSLSFCSSEPLSSPVHLSTPSSSSRQLSRDQSPLARHSHLDTRGQDARARTEREEEDENEFEDWDDGAQDAADMPSDLRPPFHRPGDGKSQQPLLSAKAGQPRHDYETPQRPALLPRRSTFKERDPDLAAKTATRKKYTYAGAFLVLSLISFTIQTETAVYIQHTLKWNKAYCMLYLTHGSWSLLWPTQLLIIRLQKWNMPWRPFFRRHLQILRSTAQMVEHQTLHIPPHLQKQSPIPYFLRTTTFVTCALTVAGGSWYVAVDMTTASDLTAIYNCSAFFAYAFAIPLLNEKLKWSKMFAVAVAIAGVLIVAYGDTSPSKHGSKSGGGAGGPNAPEKDSASNRTLGNIVIGVGSVLYGFYEVLYKKVACPPEGCSPGRGMIFANTFGSLIGCFTLLVLWIPIPVLHVLGWERFELPHGEAAWMLLISVLANATFSGSFLVLISLTSPVLSSVAALLTIFLVAIVDQLLPPPLNSPLSGAAIAGGCLIITAFLLLSWATYREMDEERRKKAEEEVDDSDVDDF